MLAALAACSSAPRISLELVPAPIAQSRAYEDFWDAALAFDFDRAHEMAGSDAQLEYVRALREVAANHLGNASTRLAALSRGANDVAPHAKSLLAAIVKDGPTIPDAAFSSAVDRSFAEALHDARSRERWRFPREPVSLILERRATPTPLLPIAVNGRPVLLGLDTGAGLTVIGSELADAAGARRLGARTSARDAHGEGVGVELATVDLDIGGIRITGHPVMVIDSSRLRFKVAGVEIAGFDGMLGWNAIRELRLEIDNPSRTVQVSRGSPNFTGPGEVFWIGEPYVRAMVAKGYPVTLFFDTGASRSALASTVTAAAGMGAGEMRPTLVMGAGSSRRVEVTVHRDAHLHAGGTRIGFGELQSIEPRNTGYAARDGVLGADALVEGKVILDFRAGIFSVSPR